MMYFLPANDGEAAGGENEYVVEEIKAYGQPAVGDHAHERVLRVPVQNQAVLFFEFGAFSEGSDRRLAL